MHFISLQKRKAEEEAAPVVEDGKVGDHAGKAQCLGQEGCKWNSTVIRPQLQPELHSMCPYARLWYCAHKYARARRWV